MTSPNNAPDVDPLLGAEKRPAVSWKDVPLNQIKRLEVESVGRTAQQTVFGSNPPKLAFWPGNNPGEQGNPKMAVVFDVNENGEEKSLWAPIPSSLRTALAKAQTEAGGGRIGPGGVLEVAIVGKEDKGKGNPQNIFKAKYTPPAPGAGQPDPLSGQESGGSAPATSDPWATPAGGGDEPPF